MKQLFAIVVFSVFLHGCYNNLYFHQSGGALTYSDDSSKSALIYWHSHEGRQLFWRFNEPDSSANLRICQSASAFTFEPAEDGTLVMRADNGDRLIAAQSTDGQVTQLETKKRAVPGEDVCGALFIDGKPATMVALGDAKGVSVTILCDSPMSPGRYPKATSWQFDKVIKTEVENQVNPSPCEELE